MEEACMMLQWGKRSFKAVVYEQGGKDRVGRAKDAKVIGCVKVEEFAIAFYRRATYQTRDAR